jgi:hypothetical protein
VTAPALRPDAELTCVICGDPADVVLEPPRRTIARGLDPEDPSFSITAILPRVPLCGDHNRRLADKEFLLGWCDDEHCRTYGERDTASSCGRPFATLV